MSIDLWSLQFGIGSLLNYLRMSQSESQLMHFKSSIVYSELEVYFCHVPFGNSGFFHFSKIP